MCLTTVIILHYSYTFFFFTFIQQGHKPMKSDSNNFCNVTNDFYFKHTYHFELCIHQKKKKIYIYYIYITMYTKILSSMGGVMAAENLAFPSRNKLHFKIFKIDNI